jgi:drug/metabolite transporter (DMT)-like permease
VLERLQSRSAVAGIAFMCLGMAMFSFNDALGKWLLGAYTVGMVLLIRSAAALAVLLPMAVARGELGAVLSPPQPQWQIIRVVLTTFEASCFYWAVSYMPLAETVAFWLATPIYVAMLAQPLLGEQTPLRRWVAIGIGFVGVLIALDPTGGAMGWPAVVALAGSFAFALCMIVTRKLRGTPDITLVTWQTVAALLLGAALVPSGWVQPSLRDFGLLALIGIVAMGAHIFTNRSLKLAPASVVVPYQYTLIVWAVILGWLVWGDVPALSTILGVVVIIAAGVWIFWDEAKAGQEGLAEAEEVRG